MIRMMLDYLINPKLIACTSERKYILWLTDNLDSIFHMFTLLPDMQFSSAEKALLRLYC